MKEKYQAAYPKKDKLLDDWSKYLKSVRKKRDELQKTFKLDKLCHNIRASDEVKDGLADELKQTQVHQDKTPCKEPVANTV